MESELFAPETTKQLSPKLKWLEQHGLETEDLSDLGGIDPCTGDDIPRWVCRVKKTMVKGRWMAAEVGGGDTETDACAEYAVKNGLHLWNEMDAA